MSGCCGCLVSILTTTILLVGTGVYIVLGWYVVYHTREVVSIYDQSFIKEQTILFELYNKWSCEPTTSGKAAKEANPSAFRERAEWWREHCLEIIEETNTQEGVLQLASRITEKTIERHQDQEAKTWHSQQWLNEIIYWGLRDKGNIIETMLLSLFFSSWLSFIYVIMYSCSCLRSSYRQQQQQIKPLVVTSTFNRHTIAVVPPVIPPKPTGVTLPYPTGVHQRMVASTGG